MKKRKKEREKKKNERVQKRKRPGEIGSIICSLFFVFEIIIINIIPLRQLK